MASITPKVSTDVDDYPSLASANYCLSLLFSAYILSFVDRQILSLLVGPIRADFGISDFEYSLLAGAAFAVLYAIAGLPLGRLADRMSRKHIIATAVLFWSAMTMACGLTKNFSQLFIARMGVGAGEAGLSPAAYSLILDSFKPAHVNYAMSIYKLGVKVGAGLALVIGGVLYDFYAGIGDIALPIIGLVKPWQLTLITVGAPGLILSLMFLTVAEPKRKGMMTVNNSNGSMPIGEVMSFMWQRRRIYLSLLLGSSLMAMAQYGSSAWYPELFTRKYGFSKSEAGVTYGSILLIGGSVGVLGAAWCASQLKKRGYLDANVRTMLAAALLAIPLMVAAPLAGTSQLTIIILWPAIILSGSYLGIMAVSIVEITPNQMRGQITALYIFATSMLGMAVGTSIMAAFTDFLFKDDALLHYSIATSCGIFYPLGAFLFWYSRPAYKEAIEDAASWR